MSSHHPSSNRSRARPHVTDQFDPLLRIGANRAKVPDLATPSGKLAENKVDSAHAAARAAKRAAKLRRKGVTWALLPAISALHKRGLSYRQIAATIAREIGPQLSAQGIANALGSSL